VYKHVVIRVPEIYFTKAMRITLAGWFSEREYLDESRHILQGKYRQPGTRRHVITDATRGLSEVLPGQGYDVSYRFSEAYSGFHSNGEIWINYAS